MTYWILNPKTLEHKSIKVMTEEKQQLIKENQWLVFEDEWEMLFKQQELKQIHGNYNGEDILAMFEVASIPLSVNHEIECFETIKPNLVNQTELVNQISKSKRGGRREGAGAKKGISKSIEHKDKISKSMKGKRNAVRTN
jgi:hypothetical protein